MCGCRLRADVLALALAVPVEEVAGRGPLEVGGGSPVATRREGRPLDFGARLVGAVAGVTD